MISHHTGCFAHEAFEVTGLNGTTDVNYLGTSCRGISATYEICCHIDNGDDDEAVEVASDGAHRPGRGVANKLHCA